MRWTRKTASLILVILATASCSLGQVCTDIGGVPLISLTVPDGAKVLEFCIDGFDCTDQLAGSTADVFVDDENRFDYEYTARVQLKGEVAEFAGEVVAEPTFPNGERCGRSGKRASLVVIDADTIEQA